MPFDPHAGGLLLVRGVCEGEPSATLVNELDVNYSTVLTLRRALQANAEWLPLDTPLPDEQTETDEMFQHVGKKGDRPLTPPTRLVVGPTNAEGRHLRQ